MNLTLTKWVKELKIIRTKLLIAGYTNNQIIEIQVNSRTTVKTRTFKLDFSKVREGYDGAIILYGLNRGFDYIVLHVPSELIYSEKGKESALNKIIAVRSLSGWKLQTIPPQFERMTL